MTHGQALQQAFGQLEPDDQDCIVEFSSILTRACRLQDKILNADGIEMCIFLKAVPATCMPLSIPESCVLLLRGERERERVCVSLAFAIRLTWIYSQTPSALCADDGNACLPQDGQL